MLAFIVGSTCFWVKVGDVGMSDLMRLLMYKYNYWYFHFLVLGCLYRSRHVCTEGKKSSCHPGRLWNGSHKGGIFFE